MFDKGTDNDAFKKQEAAIQEFSFIMHYLLLAVLILLVSSLIVSFFSISHLWLLLSLLPVIAIMIDWLIKKHVNKHPYGYLVGSRKS